MMRFAAAWLALALPFGGPAHWWTEKGNRAYENGRYEDALQGYAEAQAHAPDAAELHYDIGNVRYRQEDFAGAADSYERALESAEGALAADSAHNLGNAMFRQQDYASAIDAYRRALQDRPGDPDTLRNLEQALRLRQEPPPQEQPQDSEGEGEDESPESQPQPAPGDSPPEDAPPQPQPTSSELSPEQAERLLDALRDAETERKQEEQDKKKGRRGRTKEKDW